MRKLFLTLSAIFCLLVTAISQNRTVTGRVQDDNGQSVAGATVLVKNTRTGTTTDAGGNFSLRVPSSARTIVISGVGFATQEVAIGSGNNLSINLKQDLTTLEQVVVTGYSREKKATFTGAATVVTAKAIETVPVGAFDQALQGRVPGLVVNSGSGQPGASASLHIRGISSITAAFSDPLYIIDGIPLRSSDVATINPDDFESITVLKDAAASALYGARGGLGVVVITTKRGKAGQTNFTYRTQMGITQRPQPSQFDQMNSTEMLGYEELVGTFNAGLTAPGWVYSPKNPAYAALPGTSPTATPYAPSQARYNFLLDSLRNNNTDYYDLLFRQGVSTTHEINMSGGTTATRYFVSLGYFSQDGTDRKSYLKRYTARFNIDNTMGKLNTQLTTAVGYSKTNYN
jgi:TonB-linked SusC/RagA family outer membrane protein